MNADLDLKSSAFACPPAIGSSCLYRTIQLFLLNSRLQTKRRRRETLLPDNATRLYVISLYRYLSIDHNPDRNSRGLATVLPYRQ